MLSAGKRGSGASANECKKGGLKAGKGIIKPFIRGSLDSVMLLTRLSNELSLSNRSNRASMLYTISFFRSIQSINKRKKKHNPVTNRDHSPDPHSLEKMSVKCQSLEVDFLVE